MRDPLRPLNRPLAGIVCPHHEPVVLGMRLDPPEQFPEISVVLDAGRDVALRVFG